MENMNKINNFKKQGLNLIDNKYFKKTLFKT